MKDVKLDLREGAEVTIEAGLQLIPYVGSAISTAYFSTKQAKAFKRLENFYAKLAEEMILLEDKIKDFSYQYEDGIIALIEKVNDSIEKEHQQVKIDAYKSYIKETLMNPVTIDNYDKRSIFLDILSNVSVLECKILSIIYIENKEKILGTDINIENVNGFEVLGALNRLQSYGLLSLDYEGISFGGRRGASLSDNINKNEYGEEFIKFIISN